MINAKPSQNETPSARWNANFGEAGNKTLSPHSISGINQLAPEDKREIYTRLIPTELLVEFNIDRSFKSPNGQDLLFLNCVAGSPLVEMALYHKPGFQDPLFYGQVIDTLNGALHVLMFMLNDPRTPRYDIDCLPNGMPTRFGTETRNIPAEIAAFEAGLAPGQVRRGLRLLPSAIEAFEDLVISLGHEVYFVEPLYYHNAVLFERYGLAYEKGRRLMERIEAGFAPGGEFASRLDGSTPFRTPEAAGHIRMRSWALHDGLLDEPFSCVTMYKLIRQPATLNTCPGCPW